MSGVHGLLLAAALHAPWGLLALLLLPALAWLYRRRPRPPAQALPSLLFLDSEGAPPAQREARRVEADLLLALGAALLLALAASTPVLGGQDGGRVVRVVVSGGVPSTQEGYARRVDAALEEVRSALAPGDRLEVVHVPAGPGSEGLPRPSAQALLAAARAGAPTRALVVSDLRVGEAEVLARPVGDTTLGNVGLVALARGTGDLRSATGLHVLVRNDSPREARATLLQGAATGAVLATWPLSLAPGEVRALALPRPEAGGSLWLEHARPAGDALAADDRVGLGPARLRVLLDERLAPEVRTAARAALVAALGDGGVEEVGDGAAAGLRVVPLEALSMAGREPRGPWLALAVPQGGAAGVEVPQGPEQRIDSDLVRDVSLAGLRLWRASVPAPAAGEDVRWLLSRAGVGLLGEAASGDVLLACDLLAGQAPLAAQPAWPLLVDNLVRRLLGVPAEGEPGLRVTGLHAPESTRLGREQAPLPPGWLEGPARPPPPGSTSLVALLAAGAGLLLAVLWWREAQARRRLGSR